MTSFFQALPNSPLISFTLLLLVILTIPPIFERLQLPGLVGLLVAGVFLGPDGIGLLSADSETMELLADIGKIYLMFVAGLEIDLAQFRRTKNRSLGFGFATFIIPMIAGIIVGRVVGLGWNASILIGSLLASHTLLGYPIVNRLGVVNNEAVTVTIGATIFTDIAALLVLAVCVSVHDGDFSAASLMAQLVALGVYSAIVLFGFDWAGKVYFRRTGDEQSNQFLFVLLAVFLASVGAQIVNVDKIVGAFLAGLAVNDVVGGSPVKEKVEFVGSTLFIPFFFVNMGLLLSLSSLAMTLTSELALTVMMVGGLISSKFLAALVAKLLYRYSWNEMITMWSLSLPQVAATLAAALVGVTVGVINISVFNAVIVMMLVTAILGPVLTGRFARSLTVTTTLETVDLSVLNEEMPIARPEQSERFTVLIPIYNPYTQRYLIEMGALLANREQGYIVPLAIAKASVHMDDPQLNAMVQRCAHLLERAIAVGEEFNVASQPRIRIDDDIAHGISRAAREANANLIVMGWSPTTSLQARLFGTVIDNVFWSSHCPVAVMRLLDEPVNLHRILVPVKNITPQALQTVRFAQWFAETHAATITVLHVCDRFATQPEIGQFQDKLDQFIAQSATSVPIIPKIICQDNIAKAILHQAQSYDLVLLRSVRRRTVGGLAVSDVTTAVLSKLDCSLVLFGDTTWKPSDFNDVEANFMA
ncbi:cation:proton antiporter [Spirulina major CS-329]|uniref:cation:proton antiporter domain-containing protein n=1 Tax=Spirulina TaxID=1154 RepID=UPI00232FF5FD|nr:MULTISPECIES: cation:proton antiporter [Spirulina]MDB9494369.1 cation:proton antiporter [Spirulina subsalsa CS-330]MDB9501680.1 cation:proton antiporter [Spirulina major CS-329]